MVTQSFKSYSFPEDKWQQWKCWKMENPLIIHMNEILITTESKMRWRLALSDQLLLSPPVVSFSDLSIVSSHP